MALSIQTVISESGVNFGTSGVRGLVKDMTDKVCFAYVSAFLKHIENCDFNLSNKRVGIAGDLRSSTDRIMNACAAACEILGFEPINLGKIPSPAVALFGLSESIPTIMVTGSHIPEDRNGIKFNTPIGEILKSDELAIKSSSVEINEALFESEALKENYLPTESTVAYEQYLDRYLKLFDHSVLSGVKVGIYQHSSVARDFLPSLFEQLGAEVVLLGRSEHFVSVDTEAIRPEDIELGKVWSQQYALDCIVSTDGDADRPLVSDENGEWLRGDIAGILTAQFVGATAVVTPISSNTALEKSELFEQTVRTKIGSPYVIEAMMELAENSSDTVVGYEANGGFLQQTEATISGHSMSSLPTRDAVIVMLAVILSSKYAKQTISEVLKDLPQRFTASDRIKGIPTEKSQTWLSNIIKSLAEGDTNFLEKLMPEIPNVTSFDTTDGLRITLKDNSIVHFRPSGNAPELRCYTESENPQAAVKLNTYCLNVVADLLS